MGFKSNLCDDILLYLIDYCQLIVNKTVMKLDAIFMQKIIVKQLSTFGYENFKSRLICSPQSHFGFMNITDYHGYYRLNL